MNAKVVTVLMAAGLFLSGCYTQMVKRDVILDASGNKPEWLNKQTYERDGNFYIVGEGFDSESYSLAQRIAKATVAQSLAEAASLKIKSELTQSVQRLGLSSSGSFIQDTVAFASEKVIIQNLVHEEDYREKIQRAEDDAIRYHVVSLYRLPLTDFKAAKIRALEAVQQRAVSSADRKAAEDARRLLDEVKAE